MKKFLVAFVMSVMLVGSAFCISEFEKSLLPEYKGDLSKVDHKVIEVSDTDIIAIIDGVVYVIKLK